MTTNVYDHVENPGDQQRALSLVTSTSHDSWQWNCFPSKSLSGQHCKIHDVRGKQCTVNRECWPLARFIFINLHTKKFFFLGYITSDLSFKCVTVLWKFNHGQQMMIITFNIIMILLLVIRCPLLSVLHANPPNGICSNPDLSYYSYCSFKCSHGYQLKGSEVRVCQLDKTWSGASTTCEGTRRITLL